MLPAPDILNEFNHGRFVLSNLAAKRANQLREGAPPLVQIDSTHPLTIALAEIASGKIKAIMPELDDRVLIEGDIDSIIDETLPSDLGLLLPALDETETKLVLGEDEHEVEVEHDEELSLAGLLDEEEDAPAAVAEEDDTLSLTDIAEQETSEEEESED
jgi:DNA-directed RNA polymerase subunit omega